MKKRGQSALDIMMLLGFVAILVIPLASFLWRETALLADHNVMETAESLRENVNLLRTLGKYSATRFVISLPSGATMKAEQNVVRIRFGGNQEYTISLPIPIVSPEIQGGIRELHLYYDGTRAIIQGCGNTVIDSGEECDGALGACIQGKSQCQNCHCTCDSHDDCATNFCDLSQGACRRCENDAECPVIGMVCREGNCMPGSGQVGA